MTTDPWHYPRGELAAHLLQVLDANVVYRLAIFAPRRKGKTWFVLRDLAPAAIRRDYVPVYASLWRTPDTPHIAISEAFQVALNTLKQKQPSWSDYLAKLSSVSVNLAGVGGGIGLVRAQESSPEDMAEIGRLLDAVVRDAARRRRRVLLLIDEAQHLATRTAFESVAKSLRTAMEGIEATKPGALRTVFTGSSRTDLAALLEDRNAAFYRSFDQQELPDLDQGYTDFVAAQLLRLGRVRVNRDALWQTFCDFHKSPHYMQQVIRELMLKRAATLDEAKTAVVEAIRENPELAARWRALGALEQALFLRLEGDGAAYSKEALKQLERATGEPVGVSQVQSAIRQLTRKGLISPVKRGDYRIEDPELVTWLALRSD